MNINLIQDLLVILIAGYVTLDNLGITIFNYWAVTTGMLVGLAMGDLKTGLLIGGTFQLMSLGVAGLGGASVPDYGLAAIVGTFLAIRTGSGLSTAVAVGLPVGLLAINLDVLVKILNNFIAHKMQTLAHERKFREMRLVGWAGPAMFALKNIIVTTIIVFAGPSSVNAILKVIPKWVTNGLNIAGGMLPVLGIALLMHYMPLKKYFWALLIGFVFSAYLNLPIIGIAILGAAGSIIVYKSGLKDNAHKAEAASDYGKVTNGDDDYDE
ncbi:PTS N-acetylgalactosamine transporter subunit IIA [Oenococcus oeni]|uniref:PTS mannose/fructose/sorbose/N-acetylgalactosamine transporter subunit IIC n=1 Tax=Oenococcus oeni TaxID=1247 RepID=UPI0010B976A2|nr:PTS sugar transporter subunit IIC [Oenococcus oeni]SYW04891.1 PTS N-acetylgalactosamine transporter subunit IIA [Oenococcus oeni]